MTHDTLDEARAALQLVQRCIRQLGHAPRCASTRVGFTRWEVSGCDCPGPGIEMDLENAETSLLNAVESIDREMGPRPVTSEDIADAKADMAHDSRGDA